MRTIATLLAALALTAPTFAQDELSRKEIKGLMQELHTAASGDDWYTVQEKMQELAATQDKKVWKFIVKYAEQAPPRRIEDVASDLIGVARQMEDGKGVEKEIAKTARKSKSPQIRLALTHWLGDKGLTEDLIEAMSDDHEQVAHVAANVLANNRVEEAVPLMIALMKKHDDDRGHIWDTLRICLGRMLGQKVNSGVEYESLWTLLKEKGGLSAVEPKQGAGGEGGGPVGEMKSSVALFNRPIECTRVVFILDVSGSMEQRDPDQKPLPPDDEDGTKTRDTKSETKDDGIPRGPDGRPLLTRLERAQAALKRVLKKLPESYEVNIVAYSTRTRIWRATGGTDQNFPKLHKLTKKNREDACKFVDNFAANGVTATDSALERAFGVQGVRCFYLLSDGKATRDGVNQIPTRTIVDLIDELGENKFITIHTMGFKGADRQMMKTVAEHTGGQYSDIR